MDRSERKAAVSAYKERKAVAGVYAIRARRPASNGSARRPIFPRSGPAARSRCAKASRRTGRFSPPGTLTAQKVSPSRFSKRSISSNFLTGASARSRNGSRIGAACWARLRSDGPAASTRRFSGGRRPVGARPAKAHDRRREQSAMKLYFSRNYNPRLAVAAARYLNSPVEFEFASPFSPGQSEKFLKLNPNQSVPILVEGDKTLWEADAIACRLSQLAKFRLLADGRFPARRRPLDKLGLLEFRQGLRPGPFRARDQAALWPRPGEAGSWWNRD